LWTFAPNAGFERIRLFSLIRCTVWRKNNPLVPQYSWVSFSNKTLSSVHLDRFYMSHNNMRNRTLNSTVTPVPFSNHKLITVGCSLITKTFVLIGILMLNCWKILLEDRIFGKFGRLRKEDMTILFNGGRLGNCLLRRIANNILLILLCA